MTDNKKVCDKCKEPKDLSRFDKHKQAGRKTWIRSVCKDCHNERQRELRALRKQNKPKNESTKFYVVIQDGGCFAGKLPATGFRETVKAGYFPDGMIVEKNNGDKYKISGKKMVRI